MIGEDVNVLRRSQIGADAMGEPVYGPWESESVCVLSAPGKTSDLEASRPYGVKVSFTLHFPKTYTKSLKGCRIVLRGRMLRVVGDPQPYMCAPGPYDRPVEAEAIDG